MLVLTCLNVMSFNNEIEAKCLDSEDFESSNSCEYENICRSPTKSPETKVSQAQQLGGQGAGGALVLGAGHLQTAPV